ncbi:MAG: PDZ domain-containing protein [Oscillospiraceae bacterium]|nr:PDZ domain-containing protein [Oscillospiraceae bacterium]
MKKVPIGLTVGLMAITAAVTFVITGNYTLDKFNKKITGVNEKQELYSKISEIDNFVRMNYVTDMDEHKIIEGMVSGYMNGIGDGFAAYMTSEEYAQHQSMMLGVTEGLGFSYDREPGGYILITDVEAGGPAEEAGLLKGDIITAVNNTDVIAFEGGYDEAVSLFKVSEGTRVRLYIKRTTEEEGTNFIDYSVISRVSEHITVKGSKVNRSGWVQWQSISEKTPAQMQIVIDELRSMGVDSLIFDVRDLDIRDAKIMGQCLDVILDHGTVTAAYKDGHTEEMISCTDETSVEMPICVLVNERTGGVSEVFAAALRDYAGAKVVGTSTVGNGRYQMEYLCSDGSVVIFSTAELTTENSGIITGTGVIPDESVSLPEGILPFEGDIASDTQLLRALEILSGE